MAVPAEVARLAVEGRLWLGEDPVGFVASWRTQNPPRGGEEALAAAGFEKSGDVFLAKPGRSAHQLRELSGSYATPAQRALMRRASTAAVEPLWNCEVVADGQKIKIECANPPRASRVLLRGLGFEQAEGAWVRPGATWDAAAVAHFLSARKRIGK